MVFVPAGVFIFVAAGYPNGEKKEKKQQQGETSILDSDLRRLFFFHGSAH
jgi:hypothetical protein